MSDTAGGPSPLTDDSAARLRALAEAERRGARNALDRLAEKAAGDRQWEDGMGNAHAWLRDLIADVRNEMAPADEPLTPAPIRPDRQTGVFPVLEGP